MSQDTSPQNHGMIKIDVRCIIDLDVLQQILSLRTRQNPNNESSSPTMRHFNLERSKQILFSQIEDGCSARFKSFFKAASRAECAALKREMHHHLQELSPIYATIIMQESDYHHTQQDKKFFEGLYETTTEILMQAFQGQRRQAILEEELGRVLRTNQFNTLANRRRSAGHISQSSLTVRELYALKHEGDPSLNSRTLANLYQKKVNQGSVTLASVSNSPLIGNVISSDDGDDGSNTTRRNKKQSGNPNSRPQTASDEVRASFISFSREQLSSTPQQKHKIDQKQRNKFDEGMHRGLPSRGNSAASGSSFLQSRESSSRGTHPRMSSIPDESVTGSEFTPAPFIQDQTSAL